MKRYHPRLYKRRSLWYCAGDGCVGLGFDAKDAYVDWWTTVRAWWANE